MDFNIMVYYMDGSKAEDEVKGAAAVALYVEAITKRLKVKKFIIVPITPKKDNSK
jgi:hypothetical protein